MRDRAWFRGKSVYVVGLGSYGTGREVAKAMHALGAAVTVADAKSADQLESERAQLRSVPVQWELGTFSYAGAKSADLVIISPGVPLTLPPLQAAAAQGIPVVSELQVAFEISQAPFLAVTGTKGKSTTTTLLGEMLGAAGKTVRITGNIGAPAIADALDAKDSDVLVTEVSSFQLEGISSFRPRVSVFTNFHGDHLDRYPNIEAYWAAKCRLFEFQTPYDWAVLNYDDARIAGLADGIKTKAAWFSVQGEVERGAWVNGQVLWVRAPGADAVRLSLADFGLLGPHNRANAAAAAAAATVFGCPPDAIARALAEAAPLPGRLERVASMNGIQFVNDTQATTPDAARAAVAAFEERVLLLAGGRAKIDDFAPLFRGLRERFSYVILFGEGAGKMELAAREQGIRRVERCKDLEEAFRTAYRLAESGEVILLSPACASFDQYANAGARGEHFRRLVKDLRTELDLPSDSPGRAERVW